MQPAATKGKGFSIQVRTGGQYVVTPDGTKSTKKRKYRKSAGSALKLVPPAAPPLPGPAVNPLTEETGLVTDVAGNPVEDVDTLMMRDIQSNGEGGETHVDP